MDLVGFRIKEFRSIKDSGYLSLSKDGVTVLVGQNESGKTSILRALEIIEKESVNEEDFRDDGYTPQTIYYLLTNNTEIMEIINSLEMESKIFLEAIKADNFTIPLSIIWHAAESYSWHIEQSELDSLFDKLSREEDSNYKDKKIFNNFCSKLYEKMPKILLFQNGDILPDYIELNSLLDKKDNTIGYQASLNFLEAAGIGIKELDLLKDDHRRLEQKLESVNAKINNELGRFWSQHFAKQDKIILKLDLKHDPKTNQYNLYFYAKDKSGTRTLEQRSSGAQWFVSFFFGNIGKTDKIIKTKNYHAYR